MKKAERNIITAGLINLIFSIVELIGGLLTNSVAILSDAVNDFGDACSIGLSFVLDKRAGKQPNAVYTYGYARSRVVGALATAMFLLAGVGYMIYTAIHKLITPEPVSGAWVFILSACGIVLNFIAMLKMRSGADMNAKMLSFHMLEDVLEGIVVLIGSIFIWVFKIYCLDPIISIAFSVYILINVIFKLVEIFGVLMQKCPKSFDKTNFEKDIKMIDSVLDVTDMHIWTLDGSSVIASMHVLLPKDIDTCKIIYVKQLVSNVCEDYGVQHHTIQCDFLDEEGVKEP